MKFLLCLALFAATLLSGTQDAAASSVDELVTVGKVRGAELTAGDSSLVVVPIRIAEGFHVQANPAAGEFLIPLELTLALDAPDSLVSWHVVYPPPERFRLEGTTEDLLTYHDSISVEVVLRAAPGAKSGEFQFDGTVRYQACDSRRCFFPASVPVSFPLLVREALNSP